MIIMPNPEIRVKYYDVIGFEHDGLVALTMPTNDILEDDDVYYCFVVDVDPQYNDKTYTDPEGDVLHYAEIRKSIELIRVSEW